MAHIKNAIKNGEPRNKGGNSLLPAFRPVPVAYLSSIPSNDNSKKSVNRGFFDDNRNDYLLGVRSQTICVIPANSQLNTLGTKCKPSF